MLGFNNEDQAWFPCKILETVPQGGLWRVDWWNDSQEDRTKGTELCPFEEVAWWYRIMEGTLVKRCPHTKLLTEHTDNGEQEKNGCRRTGIRRGATQNAKSVYNSVTRSGGSMRETSPWGNTLQRERDRDTPGTVTSTTKDLRRILTQGQQFPFFTVKEREEGGDGHWETRMWETSDTETGTL
jgi:hypothetical protein